MQKAIVAITLALFATQAAAVNVSGDGFWAKLWQVIGNPFIVNA